MNSETFNVPAPINAPDEQEYETYVRPLLNLANQYSHATRPAQLGISTSEESKRFQDQHDQPAPSDWRAYLNDEYDMDAILDEATDQMQEKIDEFRAVLDNVDRSVIRKWLKELIYQKSFEGHAIEERVMLEAANHYGVRFERNTKSDEQDGIDGYLGGQPVSVKPVSYFDKNELPEHIDVPMLVYSIQDGQLQIHATEPLVETLSTNRQRQPRSC